MRLLQTFLLLVIATGGLLGAKASDFVEIRAIVTEADPGQGQLLGSLFNSEQTYMKSPLMLVNTPVGLHGSAILDFGKHLPGDYAVVVIYDRDNDGELNTGLFGIPTEKIGFSNNVRSRFGPAKWKDSRFNVSDNVQMEIRLGPAKD